MGVIFDRGYNRLYLFLEGNGFDLSLIPNNSEAIEARKGELVVYLDLADDTASCLGFADENMYGLSFRNMWKHLRTQV